MELAALPPEALETTRRLEAQVGGLKTRIADMGAYRDFAGTVLWQLPGVRETRTYPVMEEVKNTTHLKLD